VRLLFISILLFVLFPAADTASAQTFLFDYYTANDGLPSNWITSVYQDARGYIRVGGDGCMMVRRSNHTEQSLR
jgi:ligand-binding sensor domain-containing protein